ncbi:MAG: leucyl/phenylalanyl-tRNA--protein transferase [Phycisphaerales bacterium]|nr:leucyl/phenylalanyl-tRNA--protein transferase [Phycisphaerales bacterium]
MLRWAYARGWFPMADPEADVIDWYGPDPRGIIPLDDFHVPRNLARLLRQGRFEIRSDTAFEQVFRACAVPRSEENGTWMSPRLAAAYLDLHGSGDAHSVEAWLDGRLVGGLYGVHLGGAFFGESMFCTPEAGGSNASKVCLAHLVGWLRHRGFALLDTQFANAHLDQFGCVEIPARVYARRLGAAVARRCAWRPFDAGAALSSLGTQA